jgi:hypothetical protein
MGKNHGRAFHVGADPKAFPKSLWVESRTNVAGRVTRVVLDGVYGVTRRRDESRFISNGPTYARHRSRNEAPRGSGLNVETGGEYNASAWDGAVRVPD